MRKYYYVCPRCGRCYKRYIPRRKAKCGFCSTVWRTRKAKGTRSAFSWTATLFWVLAIGAIAVFSGSRLGVLPPIPWIDALPENAATVPDAEDAATVPEAEEAENAAE